LPVTIASGRYGWMSHPAGGTNRMLLVGSDRTVLVDANRPRLELYTDEAPWVPPNVNPADPMAFWKSTQEEVHVRPKKSWGPIAAPPTPDTASDASYFITCLEENRDSEVTAAEAALTTEVLLPADEAAATGEVIRVPVPREACGRAPHGRVPLTDRSGFLEAGQVTFGHLFARAHWPQHSIQ